MNEERPRVVVGIDPGATGAIVVVGVDSLGEGIRRFERRCYRTVSMSSFKTKKNESLSRDGLSPAGLRDLLIGVKREFTIEAVAVEFQQVRPGDGKVGAAKIVADYQAICSIVVALFLPLIPVRPQNWQASIAFEKRVTIYRANEVARLWKWSNRTKPESVAVAEKFCIGVRLLPERARKPSDGVADAACIALFAAKRVNSREV